MKRNILTGMALCAIILSGCGNLGEEPLPFPGPNDDGSVTLFVNGTIYNFDYTAQYDGIELVDYVPAKPDGTGGVFTSLGSKEGGSAVSRGIKSMEFRNDLPNNYSTPWKITLMDSKILASSKGRITFWAKFSAPYPSEVPVEANVAIAVWGSSGLQLFSKTCPIPDTNKDNEWHQYSVSFDSGTASRDEMITQWQIGVPVNAGRIYIDEIILR